MGDQSEADVELLGWEECAENMSFRVDKAWRQRCSQRFRNILDMIAKKADPALTYSIQERLYPALETLQTLKLESACFLDFTCTVFLLTLWICIWQKMRPEN